jgi:uncharacterized membrane protein YdjX (TVP38/TMEM64 family)
MNSFLELLKAWGPLGALILSFIDSVGVPNPGGPDYLLLFLGWTRPESAYWSALLAVVGSLAGSYVLFWIARKGGERYLDRKASGPRAMRFRRWFHEYGMVTLFIPALVPMFPLPMKVFVLCAGALMVHPAVFLAVVLAGRVPRYFGLAYLGRQLGQNSLGWLKQHRWDFALFALGLCVFLFLLVKVSGRLRARRAE